MKCCMTSGKSRKFCQRQDILGCREANTGPVPFWIIGEVVLPQCLSQAQLSKRLAKRGTGRHDLPQRDLQSWRKKIRLWSPWNHSCLRFKTAEIPILNPTGWGVRQLIHRHASLPLIPEESLQAFQRQYIWPLQVSGWEPARVGMWAEWCPGIIVLYRPQSRQPTWLTGTVGGTLIILPLPF